MKILIANDDGIQAKGIITLAKTLAKEHEVYVIAPDQERSAAGHALTLHIPLRVQEVKIDDSIKKSWSISGTPGDCVKIGIFAILDEKPDLIISGINHGPNLGTDILYSGTVSAAMEGAVLGFPSIAVSLADLGTYCYDFTYAADFVSKFIPRMLEIRYPTKTILNINIPAVEKEKIAGISITKIGTRMYTDSYEKRQDPRGKDYYWMAGEIVDKPVENSTDISAIRQNRISITPVTFEMTHKSVMPELEETFCGGSCNWY
jgi:5'-nucleotidase